MILKKAANKKIINFNYQFYFREKKKSQEEQNIAEFIAKVYFKKNMILIQIN